MLKVPSWTPPAIDHMIFSKFLLVSLLLLTLINCSSNKRKKFYKSSEISNDMPSPKRSRELDMIDYIDEIIKNDQVSALVSMIKNTGCDFLDPANSNILEKLILNKSEGLLRRVFTDTDTCGTNFDLFMKAVKLAHGMEDRSHLKVLLSSVFIIFSEAPYDLIQYFLSQDDFDAILMIRNVGFALNHYKIYENGKTLVHMAVEKGCLEFIKNVSRSDLFNNNDSFGMKPLCYAKDPKMIKLIRRKCPKIRDIPCKSKMPPWRLALLRGDKTVVDALISFQRRYKRFKATFLDYFDLPWSRSAQLLRVSRENVFKDSYKLVTYNKRISPHWYRPLNNFFIKFNGEMGMDAGGVKIDWISSLFKVFFEASNNGNVKDFKAPLFIKVDEDSGCYAPNVKYNPEIFKFAGSIVGISLGLSVPLKVKFIPAIYRAIYNESVDLDADLKEQSPSFYRSMKYLLESEANFADLNLSFPNNPNLKVTRRNVEKFVEVQSRSVLFDRYSAHIREFVDGFNSVLLENVNCFLFKDELIRILIGKVGEYSAEEFVDSSIFDPPELAEPFRLIITGMTPKQKALLLKFITGIETLPFNGFAGLENGRIKVSFVEPNPDVMDTEISGISGALPTSSTCSNLLKIPLYENIDELSRNLIFAIENSDTLDYEAGLLEGDEIVLNQRIPPATVDQLNHYFFESESDVSDLEEEVNQNENSAPTYKRMFKTF